MHLKKALLRMAERLALTCEELGAIIGLSQASLSRLITRPHSTLEPASNEGQLALLLLRLYRSLDTLFGGNVEQCRLWLRAQNDHLAAVPVQLVQTTEGLILVIQYLDAMQSHAS